MLFSKHIVLFGFVAAAIFFNGCTKVPTASFTFNKNEYFVGDTIILNNTSINSDSYKWKGDGIEGEQSSKDIQVITTQRGVYNFELTAYSKNGKRSNFLSKSVRVKGHEGQVTLYISTYVGNVVYLSFESEYLGTLYSNFTVTPNCGDNGCITVTLEGGDHDLLLSGAINLSKKITCVSYTCTPISVY